MASNWPTNGFTQYYGDVEPGLAQFVHDIVVESLSN
jgi:hypothetical protein